MRIILLFLALLTGFPGWAQQQDSITFVQYDWQHVDVAKGVIWKSAHFDSIFSSKQQVNIIEIDLKKCGKRLRLAGFSDRLAKTSAIADSVGALVAINGGFFDMKNGGAVDFIRIEDKLVNATRMPSKRANAFLAFNKKQVVIAGDSAAVDKYPNILLAGPFLLEDGAYKKLAKNAFNDNRHPRTAIGIKGKKLILVTVDGRNAQSQGVNLHELSKLLAWYGCADAMNLDGGGSTTMYVAGQPDQGVVNFPSDNKQFDHFGQRSVANIIYLKNK